MADWSRGNTVPGKIAGAAAGAVLLFFVFPLRPAPAGRLMPSDLEYRGAFRLPGPGWENGWGWGGNALTYYPAGDPGGAADGYPGSLYGTGHDWYQRVSEISIPVPVISPGKNLADLKTAATLQPFTDIRGDLFPEFEIPYCGLEYLPAGSGRTAERLYFGWHQHLQIDPHYPTHGWCSLDLSAPNPAGPWYIGNYDTYSTTDYLFALPQGWADTYTGGRCLATGRMRDGGQGGQGPCIYLFAPWQQGNPPPADTVLGATPLLQYSTSYWEDPHGGIYTMDRYHHSDLWPGAAWPAAGGKEAVIFAGTKGRGDCWYGNQEGPCLDCENRGWWSTYFDGEIIFFDPADLAAVARGEMEPYEPQPYAVMNIDHLLYHISGVRQKTHLAAAAADRVHGFLYVFEPLVDDDKPIVHVWKVNGGGAEPTPLPAPTPLPLPSLENCLCGPLPPPGPGEAVVHVSTVAGLQSALNSASGKTTIYLANGTYPVTGNGMVVSRPDITIRSLSGNRGDVVIRGGGMASGDSYFGVYVNASNFTLADLTIQDIRWHGVFIDPSTAPSNFLFHDIRVTDCGEQLFKASGGRDTGSKDDGVIECSTLEYTATLAGGDYTNGIDLLNSHDWVIRDNTFRNIKAGAGGSLAGPAILCWQGSSGTVVERNRIIDCDMGISLGNSSDSAPSHSGGIVRNNFIKGYANSDFGICVSRSPDAKVINNTIYSPGSWPWSIEVQYASSSGCVLTNNLADEPFYINRFETNNPQLTANLTTAGPGYFADPGRGDLHLRSNSLPAIDGGTFTPDRETDIDGQGVTGLGPDIGADERRIPAVLQSGDYNGNGSANLAFYRPASGLWAVRGLTRVFFGADADQPVPTDYTGDGTDGIAVFRESSGLWAVRGVTRIYFGRRGDIPAPGDYTGDGTDAPAIFRPSNGLWAIRGEARSYFGRDGDRPAPGYYLDNLVRPAIFRPARGLWAIRGVTRTYFGAEGDTPVPGDYDGNGDWSPAIFRPSSGLWAVRGVTRFYFGTSTDRPLPVDCAGDGTDRPGIFRGTTGLWAIRGVTRVYFGSSSDVPATR